MSFIPRTARIGSPMRIGRRALHRGLDRNVSLPFRCVAPQAPAFSVGRSYVFLDLLLELLGDAIALQRHGLHAVHIHRRYRTLARTGKRNTDIRVLAFAGPVDDAAHDRDVHLLDAGIALAPLRHLLAQEALDLFGELLEISAGGAAAARTSDHHGRERAQAHGLKQFLSDRDLARPVPTRVRGERNANRVADTLLEQYAERGGGGHDAFWSHPRLGEAQMQRIVAAAGKAPRQVAEAPGTAHFAREHDAVPRQTHPLPARRPLDGPNDTRR